MNNLFALCSFPETIKEYISDVTPMLGSGPIKSRQRLDMTIAVDWDIKQSKTKRKDNDNT